MKKILLLLFVFAFSFSLSAQQWKNYTNSINVTCLKVDADTIWIGSSGGVAKYLTNGTKLATYTHADGLASNDVTSVAIDTLGNKWFTGHGAAKFDGTNWTRYYPNSSGLSDSNVYCALVDKQNNIWLGTTSGAWKFDGINWLLYNSSNSALTTGVSHIAMDTHGNLWFNTPSIIRYDGTNWTSHPIPSFGLTYGGIGPIVTDNENNLWVSKFSGQPGTYSGLFKFNGTNWLNYTDTLGGGYYSMLIDKHDNLWLGGFASIKKFDGMNLTTYQHNNSDTNSLGYGDVHSLVLDSIENLWAGGPFYDDDRVGKGIYRFDGANWTSYNPSNSPLTSNNILSVASDRQNVKWFLPQNGGYTHGGLLSKFDGINWDSFIFSTSDGSIGIDNQNTKWFALYNWLGKFDGTNWLGYQGGGNHIAFETSGMVWTGSNGINKFDGSNWTGYDKSNSGLLSNNVSAIAVDMQNNKWVGTYDKGVFKFDGNNWTNYNTTNSGLPDSLIENIAIDMQGNKWFGTYQGGIAKFDGSNWTIYNTTNSGLPSNWISAIVIDKHNNKWIATEPNTGDYFGTSITKYNGSNWTTYNIHNSGFASGGASSISVDEQNNIWIGTYRCGISELISTDSTFLVWLQFNQDICDANTITLNPVINYGTPPYTFAWQSTGNSLNCNNCQNPMATITQNSTFIITVTDSNNNITTDTLRVYYCGYTTINEIPRENYSIILYPNPTNTALNIQIENFNPVLISVFDINGRKISEQRFAPQIDVSTLSTGIYFIELKGSDAVARKRFVKM